MNAYCVYWDLKGIGYTCKVMSIEQPNTEVKFNGAHLPNKKDRDVQILNIDGKTVKFLPINLNEKFKNLVTLSVCNSELEKISELDLAGLESLEGLYLKGNKLTSLPDNLFANKNKLKIILLQDNKLEYLSSKLLEPIRNTVERVDFRRNIKIDHCYRRNEMRLEDFLNIIDTNCIPPENVEEKQPMMGRWKNLSLHFEKFRVSGKYSDFTIKVHGKEFKVHKNILAAQSTVFDEMFTAETTEGAKTFTNIKNFNERSFECFLNFFYTGRADAEADPVEVFELASEFDVPDLKTASIERVIEILTEDNAIKVFDLGKQHKSDELVQAAFKTLKSLYPDLIDAFIDDADSLKEFVDSKRKIAALLKAKTK